jgi:hypothetical protein
MMRRSADFLGGSFGDRFDMGDEHTLFSEDGKEICKFGGYAGHVTSGVCNIERIIYVRTL